MDLFKSKHIPFFYLYDSKGSELFDEITKLEEYYPYRKEEEILRKFSEEMLVFDDDLKTEKITLVEFGAGYSTKTDILIKVLLEKYSNVEFIPVDVSQSACELTHEKYKKLLEVNPFVGTYDEYLDKQISHSNRVIYIWLGSTIGNHSEPEQQEFLKKVSRCMSFRDVLLIGFDTIYKDVKTIKNAYDDKLGLTGKFILNSLSHLKEKFGLTLEEKDFCYEVEWNQEKERIEMYIKCTNDTEVTDDKKGETCSFKNGDKIFVEFSHKFSTEKVDRLAHSSHLMLKKTWFTPDKFFMFCQFLKDINPLWNRADDIFFKFIKPENFQKQPILLRNKFIFYLGHLTNFYDIRVLDLKPNEPYFAFFERGRDPDVDQPEYCHRHSNINVDYPPYSEVVDYIKRVRDQVISHILGKGYCFRTLCSIEHEIMHQETLFYMLRMTDSDAFVDSIPSLGEYTLPTRKVISIPNRRFIQGSEETFVWDNESPKHEIEVEAFKVDNLPITWEDMKEFLMESGRFKTEMIPNLNDSMQVRISQNLWVDFERAKHLPAWVCLKVAREYLEWIQGKKGIKARLMTESEFDSLATANASTKTGNINFKHHHAMPIGFYSDYSEDGVGELFGNGWELTTTNFMPFEGFKPLDIYGEYSQDFFNEDYFVIKGASPYTNEDLTRKSFRNWFQYNYVYHPSKFRLVYDI